MLVARLKCQVSKRLKARGYCNVEIFMAMIYLIAAPISEIFDSISNRFCLNPAASRST